MSSYIAIVDYGAGNLFSLKNALDYIGVESEITARPEDLERSAAVILPGVGAFPDAMDMLARASLVRPLCKAAAEKPFLGICLGMQLLFEVGTEFARTDGLGLIPGSVVKLQPGELPIPHMGWNSLRIRANTPLLDGVPAGSCVYFVHSYRAQTDAAYVLADAQYGEDVPAVVGRGTVFGCQFHPEKSGETGLEILRNFGRMAK